MDITKHKQAEELLRESEERYKGLFINMNSGVAIYKVKGDAEDFIFTDFNKAAERIDKQKKEELIGRSVFEARPQVEEFGLIDVFREVWKTGKPKHYPITLYKDEKLDAWYENFIYKLPSGDIVAVFTNETDLKKVQEAFKKSEDIYRSMMESMKDAVYICSSDLRIEYMNPAMVERIGHDAIGEICHKSIYGMDEKCSWCVFDLLGQKDHIDYDLVDPKKNRYYSVANSPIFHSNGTFSKLTIFRDITQQKLNQEDLKKSAEQLRALALRHTHLEEAEKKKLALELHDRVGQNLTGLNINLNIIENMLPPDSPDKISDRLSDSLAITDKIFKHIRDVMADLRPETLDDYGLVAALGLYCKKFESRYNIRTQIKGSEFTPRLELEKEIALFRIVQEAMANAARHAMVEMITLTFESNDIINRMTIADNGVGFDYNKLKLLGNNNHWGLIIMQERAIAIGVNFSIESGKDKGTKVIVKIKK
jgi:signal transduction histidine kinase